MLEDECSGYFTNVTGSFVRCTTLVATEPITKLPIAPMPRVPITMPSQLSSSALLTIIDAVSPTRTSLVQGTLAALANSIAGRKISPLCALYNSSIFSRDTYTSISPYYTGSRWTGAQAG